MSRHLHPLFVRCIRASSASQAAIARAGRVPVTRFCAYVNGGHVHDGPVTNGRLRAVARFLAYVGPLVADGAAR